MTGRYSVHSSLSQCFCEGATLRDLLRYWIACRRCGLTRAIPDMERTQGDQCTVLLHYHHLGCTAAQAHHQLKKVHGSEALSQDVLEMVQEIRQRRSQHEGPATIRRTGHRQGRGYSEPSIQIMRMVCGRDRCFKENRSSCLSREREEP